METRLPFCERFPDELEFRLEILWFKSVSHWLISQGARDGKSKAREMGDRSYRTGSGSDRIIDSTRVHHPVATAPGSVPEPSLTVGLMPRNNFILDTRVSSRRPTSRSSDRSSRNHPPTFHRRSWRPCQSG